MEAILTFTSHLRRISTLQSSFVHIRNINKSIESTHISDTFHPINIRAFGAASITSSIKHIEGRSDIGLKLSVLLHTCKGLCQCESPIFLASLWFCRLHSTTYYMASNWPRSPSEQVAKCLWGPIPFKRWVVLDWHITVLVFSAVPSGFTDVLNSLFLSFHLRWAGVKRVGAYLM